MGHQSAECCEEASPARGGARARRGGGGGQFLFFAFTSSPVCPKLLSERKKRVKVFALLPSHAVHPFWRHGEGSASPSLHPKMVEIVCVVVGR